VRDLRTPQAGRSGSEVLPMSYPNEDVDAFEFRMHDPVTGDWFYQTAPSWGEFERTLISVSRHRGHPMELWAIRREDADYQEPEAPWMESDGFLLPWKRVARVGERQIDWSPAMNGPSMGAARKRRVKPTKMKLAKAELLAEVVQGILKPYVQFSQVVGSVRRQVPVVGDIELVVLPNNLDEFLDFLKEAGGFSGGERKQVGRVGKDFPVELYIAHDPKELGGLVFMYTGNFTFNIAMRMKAKKRGLKLNQYGIWMGAKPVLQSEDEVDFFEFLGVRYHEPEERSLARRGKPKKAVQAQKMGGDDDDFERFWDGEEE
jgi:hypothetical protein